MRNFGRAALFGICSGMRASAPLVAGGGGSRPLEWYALLGEISVDKLPFTPSRLQPGAWLGRAAFAGYGAYRDAQMMQLSPARQAAIAAAVALVSTKIAHDVRQTLATSWGLPDFLIALVEDALTLSCVVHLRSTRGER